MDGQNCSLVLQGEPWLSLQRPDQDEEEPFVKHKFLKLLKMGGVELIGGLWWELGEEREEEEEEGRRRRGGGEECSRGGGTGGEEEVADYVLTQTYTNT